jgi:hypothetical protein
MLNCWDYVKRLIERTTRGAIIAQKKIATRMNSVLSLTRARTHVTLARVKSLQSPHDTVLTALLRFALELAALFCIGAAFGVVNFLISVFVLALFNAKGDKRLQGIVVSGPVRLLIEVAIALLGIYAAAIAFDPQWALVFGAVWVGYLFLGRERLLWLAQGAK